MNKKPKDTRERILAALGRAEQECTEILLEAVRTRNANALEVAGNAAIRVRSLIEDVRAAEASESEGNPESRTPEAVSKNSARGPSRNYPKFHIENGDLVRIGWSKKKKKEYVQKIPKAVYETTLDLIADRVARTGEPFVAEEIVNAASEQEEPIPAYQAYLTLAYLQSQGILNKRGRQGYTGLSDVKKEGLAAWN